VPHALQARPARGERRPAQIERDPAVLASLCEDAAHVPGGHARGLVVAATEADIAAAMALDERLLAVGSQSSLTGGATPMDDVVISMARMQRIVEIGNDRVRVQSGVTLEELDRALVHAGAYYPPAPTFVGASVGGTVATNAAGAATFKYGTTRDWVLALTVVLPNGEVLDVERGKTRAHPDGYFELVFSDRTARVPVPSYRMPNVRKLSAGYFAQPAMDLIDLFIGSEGTLGIITAVTLRLVTPRPAICLTLVPFRRREDALAMVRRLREAARETWRARDPSGLDVSGIEHIDRRSLALLQEDGVDRELGIVIPERTEMVLLVALELPPGTSPAQAFEEIGRAADADAPRTPLVSFCRELASIGVLDHVEIAVPGDSARAAQIAAFREAVPESVNRRVAWAKQTIDPRIQKTAADMIVPFEQLERLLARYDEEFRRRGLDAAVWGHISDGNLHPNVIPRSLEDVDSGRAAILEIGRFVIELGGSPLAEHGVGRNTVKQQLLSELYGRDGIEQMRLVKRAIDPTGKLAPGVLFPA
jgi:D-lactate dehydrogenase (cytochrome)